MSTFGDFTVARTSVKNVLNASGVLASVAANTPALEFNADGSYRGTLVEPAATNLFVRSSEFNTTWGKTDITVTDNSIASPDGTTTADTITEGTANSAFLSQGVTVASGATVAGSIWLKVGSVNDFVRIAISQSGTFGNNVVTWFRFSTGVLSGTANSGTGTGATASVQAFPNGWYRISLSGAIPAVTSYIFSVNSASASGSGTRVNNSVYYAWGAQLETGAVATSYIPTVASTETRTADSVTLTGASSLIGQTQGTMFVEVEILNFAQTNARGLLYLSDGTTNNRIGIQVGGATDEVQLISSTSGSTLVSITTNNNPSGIQKYAGAYALNDFAFYNNGVSIGTDTSATVPATSRIDIGGIIGAGQFQGWIRAVALYPTRLSNAQLATLTTP